LEAAAEEVVRAERRGASLAVALIDLDGFKEINDEHGHGFGDRLLRETCAAWSRELRRGDLLGRYGGDEFVLLLPDCDGAALAVVERLAGVQTCACTIGLTLWRPGESVEDLLLRVDGALYDGKRSGRGRVVFAS
jgi:diguanylate cyclase (GGDEF)-like protein